MIINMIKKLLKGFLLKKAFEVGFRKFQERGKKKNSY